jgi:aminocarboxymuconate-semialdehyde decarboxylase
MSDSSTAPIIDVHAHAWTVEIEKLVRGRPGHDQHLRTELRRAGEESMRLGAEQMATRGPLLQDPDARLAAMDRAGVDAQVVSIAPTQFHQWTGDAGLARELVDVSHQVIGALVAWRPDRLTGLGVVPQQFPELTADALQDAVLRHGLKGVAISSHAPAVNGGGPIDLSDRRYDDLWACASALGAVILLHPWGCTLEERLDQWYLSNSVGQPVEHVVALSHLIVGGVLERFPGLRLIAAHGGGHLPGMLGRADHAWHHRSDARTTPRPPSTYLRDLWFDSLVYEPEALRRLVDATGADRVVLGSDYPFDMGVEDPVSRVQESGLPPEVVEAVLGGNAHALGLTPAALVTQLAADDAL